MVFLQNYFVYDCCMKALTKQYIFDVFYKMMLERPFSSIRVKEICDACGISRATFYEYFPDKYELGVYLIDLCADRSHPPGSTKTRYEQFVDLLKEIRKHTRYFRNLYKTDTYEYAKFRNRTGFENLYRTLLVEPMRSASNSGIKAKYYAQYHSAGVTELFVQWSVMSDPDITAEEMGEIIYKCLSPSLQKAIYNNIGPDSAGHKDQA